MCSRHFKNCLDFPQTFPKHAPTGFRVHGFVYPVFMHASSGFAKLNCGIYRLGSFIKGHACAPRFLKTAYIFHKNFPCMLPEVFVCTVSYIRLSCMLPEVSRNSTVVYTAWKFYQRACMCSKNFKNCLDFSQIFPMQASRGFRVHGFVYPVVMNAPRGLAKLNCGIYGLEVSSKGMNVLHEF